MQDHKLCMDKLCSVMRMIMLCTHAAIMSCCALKLCMSHNIMLCMHVVKMSCCACMYM